MPAHLSDESLRRMVSDNIKKGLPHLRRGGELFFDRLDSWNWLYDHEPRFFEADYRALEEKRRRFFVREGKRIRSRQTWQRYRVQYLYRIFPEGFRPGQQLRIFVPFPIPRENHQQDIRLLSCKPADMEGNFASTLGYFYGYNFAAAAMDRPWDFGYCCELSVREQGEEEGGKRSPLTETERRRYLELEPGLLEQPEVVRFRGKLRETGAADDEGRARAIYEALAGHKRFKKTKDRSQNLTYSTVAVLREEGGHCTTLSRAFISLCRAEGLAAREVTGALIGYPAGERRYAMQGYGEPLFGHTWAEVFVEGRGWVPVEFHGVVIGEQAMTGDNVTEPQLRALVRENGPPYRDYYFGHVDNQRLVCSNSVKYIPPCLVENADYPPGAPQRWQSPPDLRFECRLEVECL
jgi:transglutaminase-like putative cysteine protease